MPDDDVVSLSVFVALSLFNSLGHGSVILFSFEEKRTKGMEAIQPTALEVSTGWPCKKGNRLMCLKLLSCLKLALKCQSYILPYTSGDGRVN